MKSAMKRLSAFLVVVFVFIIISGVVVFSALAVDYYHNGESFFLSEINEFLYEKSSATEVIEKGSVQNLSRPTVSADAERVLNIWETSLEKEPLSDVSFAVYEVCSLDEYYSGAVKLNVIPSEDEIDIYSTGERLVATITTDKNGYASHSFGYGENDGVYMVCQVENAAVKETTSPFFVSFPMTNAEGSAFIYSVNVYPKNDIELTIPTIDKDISDIGIKQDSFDFDTEQLWIIRASVPGDIKNAAEYSVIDMMSNNLEFTEDSVRVVVALKNEKIYSEKIDAFIENEDYFLIAEGKNVKVSFSEVGLKKIAYIVESDFKDYEVRIYIKTKVNVGVPAGTIIKNDAKIIYRNSVGQDFTSEPEKKPGVVNGGLNVLKIDSRDGKRLPGAIFKLARSASYEEISAGNYEKIYVENGKKTETAKVVFVEFFNNVTLSGDRVKSVATDSQGHAHIYGLTYGNYYLVETKAPDGYMVLDKAVPVVVNAATHIDGNYIKVINVRKSILPSTGDSGVLIVCVLVLIFILSAVVFVLSAKKKRAV